MRRWPGGIHLGGHATEVSGGALQIRVDEDGSLSSLPVHFEVRLDVWPYWLDVGLEHALAALHARGELEGRASEQTGQWTAELLENECRAGDGRHRVGGVRA